MQMRDWLISRQRYQVRNSIIIAQPWRVPVRRSAPVSATMQDFQPMAAGSSFRPPTGS
jgi:hypothetical protein